MKVTVEVWESVEALGDFSGTLVVGETRGLIRVYHMNHDDAAERRVLGAQCRNAFEGGQCIVTYPKRG